MTNIVTNLAMPKARYDVLIIGGGAAGLSLALNLPSSFSVGLLCKGDLSKSSTYYAQGGIAAALSCDDSYQNHINDTIEAGNGLCHQPAVDTIVRSAPEAIAWLQQTAVQFSPNKHHTTGLDLGREGGHSKRRIVHCQDTTGRVLQTALYKKLKQRSNVDIFHHYIAVDLICSESDQPTNRQHCQGAYLMDCRTRAVCAISATSTVLATGGANKVYLYTTNPDSSSGDGIAMAWRAGCRIANMEFMQFHPTCLYHPQAKSFLLSEALRGEGARLLLPNGHEFMHRFDSRGVLAPRDIIARAIDHEIKQLGLNCVYLDISHKPKTFLLKRFPEIYRKCLSFGFDLASAPVPVVPAAHYTCGGIVTDLNGHTDIQSLYAIGETAHCGLHGANRLASNSLLECIVVGKRTAKTIAHEHQSRTTKPLPEWDESYVTESKENVILSHGWGEVRRIMWNYVGIVRSERRLQRAQKHITLLLEEANDYYSRYRINHDLIEFRNLAQVAYLIILSALSRKESRSLHYLTDYPQSNPMLDGIDTILTPPTTERRKNLLKHKKSVHDNI